MGTAPRAGGLYYQDGIFVDAHGVPVNPQPDPRDPDTVSPTATMEGGEANAPRLMAQGVMGAPLREMLGRGEFAPVE